jgi:hypothetical protein
MIGRLRNVKSKERFFKNLKKQSKRMKKEIVRNDFIQKMSLKEKLDLIKSSGLKIKVFKNDDNKYKVNFYDIEGNCRRDFIDKDCNGGKPVGFCNRVYLFEKEDQAYNEMLVYAYEKKLIDLNIPKLQKKESWDKLELAF